MNENQNYQNTTNEIMGNSVVIPDEQQLEFIYKYPVNRNLVCPICTTALIVPRSLSCSHTFCLKCIETLSQYSLTCPIDRLPFKLENLTIPSKIVLDLLDELSVLCPRKDFGCEWDGQRTLLTSHIKECSFVPKKCRWENCLVETIDIENHINNCEHREVSCPECDLTICFNELQSHICIPKIINCSHYQHGCRWTGIKSELNIHVKNCVFETLKEYIKSQDVKYSVLESENERLQLKLSNAESQIAEMHNLLSYDGKQLEFLNQEFQVLNNQVLELSNQVGSCQNLLTMSDPLILLNDMNHLKTQLNFIQLHISQMLLNNSPNSTTSAQIPLKHNHTQLNRNPASGSAIGDILLERNGKNTLKRADGSNQSEKGSTRRDSKSKHSNDPNEQGASASFNKL
ncbi:hypothetical protein BC833DRAFT_572899, partial [Globomyces pollinis-pini]